MTDSKKDWHVRIRRAIAWLVAGWVGLAVLLAVGGVAGTWVVCIAAGIFLFAVAIFGSPGKGGEQ